MVNGSKKPEKGTIREEDISTLLERYSIMTVLTLLQEVSKLDGDKIDWNSVAQNTATGISSARECQTLWRHLAYGQSLIGQFDDGANPMDDDSDLEYELEASPAPSYKASAEASACVKVLTASECSNNPDMPNDTTIEAPLTINIPRFINRVAPSESSLLANAVHGTNVCIPVHVPKQPVIGARGEKRPNSGTSGVNNSSQRKKAGDQNRGNSARGDVEDRKASEPSQRGANLKKKQRNSDAGTSSTVSEAQLEATRRAMNIALDMPMRVGTKSNQQSTMLGPMNSQMTRPFINPFTATNGPNPMVKAAAVAAGARIATAADASSLLEATRSQNVVHIRTGTNSSSDVQFMRNPMRAPVPLFSLPSASRQVEAHRAQGHSIKLAEPTVQAGPVGPTPINKIPENRWAPSGQSKERAEKHQSSGAENALRVNLPSEIEDNGKRSTETPHLETGAEIKLSHSTVDYP